MLRIARNAGHTGLLSGTVAANRSGNTVTMESAVALGIASFRKVQNTITTFNLDYVIKSTYFKIEST